MLEGKGSPDQRAAKLGAYRDPEAFARLIDTLVEAVAWHLLRQLEVGADVVQIFDSWAGGLPESAFKAWVVEPNHRVVDIVRKSKPDAKIIGFPRAATETGYLAYVRSTGVNAVSIDTAASMPWAVANLAPLVALQGNLDPIALIAGGSALDWAVDEILEATQGKPFIFNLGHGILPETPPENVARLVSRIRGRA
jgi:uroporphyrinogen decarboxylase